MNDCFTSVDQSAQLFSGPSASHSFIISRAGELYAIGQNHTGQLCLGDMRNRAKPTHVAAALKMNICSLSCGSGHTLICTETGDVYSCGDGRYGQLGLNQNKLLLPEKIPLSTDVMIVKIACGCASSYLLSGDGRLFSFGINCSGELGIGMKRGTNNPTLVNFGENSRITMMSAGWRHMAAVNSDSEVYTWGSNEYGQLGRDGDNFLPRKVKFEFSFNRPLQTLSCSAASTFLLADPTHLYVWGSNYYNDLGLSEVKKINRPHLHPYFQDCPLKGLRVGGFHAFCFCEAEGDRNVYVFGSNEFNQLSMQGLGGSVTAQPLIIFGSKRLGPSNVVDAVCGSMHSFLVSETGNCYGCGNEDAFSSSVPIFSPKFVFADVSLLSELEVVSNDLVEYILSEQHLSQEETRISDSEIRLGCPYSTHSLLVDSTLVSTKIGRSLVYLDSHVMLGGNVERILLMYLYSGAISQDEIKSLTRDEVCALVELLEKYSFGASLSQLCMMYFPFARKSGLINSHNPKESLDVPLYRCLRLLFQTKSTTGDVAIRSGDHYHRAHKFILAARSNYFSAMFRGGFKESSTNLVEMDMPLGEPFESYLRYIYTGELVFPTSHCKRILEYLEYFYESTEEDARARKYCEVKVGGSGEPRKRHFLRNSLLDDDEPLTMFRFSGIGQSRLNGALEIRHENRNRTDQHHRIGFRLQEDIQSYTSSLLRKPARDSRLRRERGRN